MPLLGGCCCGAIRYATIDSVTNATICHCPTCRRACGAPHVAWYSVALADYHVTAGTPGRYNSSAGVTRTFCGACGTQLTYAHHDWPDMIDVTVSTLDEPELVVPQDHTFTRYRLGWDVIGDGKPAFPRTRSEGLTPAQNE